MDFIQSLHEIHAYSADHLLIHEPDLFKNVLKTAAVQMFHHYWDVPLGHVPEGVVDFYEFVRLLKLGLPEGNPFFEVLTIFFVLEWVLLDHVDCERRSMQHFFNSGLVAVWTEHVECDHFVETDFKTNEVVGLLLLD